jgi:predicted deacylase
VRHATHVLDVHTWNRWQAAATTVRSWHAPSLALAKSFGLWVQARPDQPVEPGDDSFVGSITGVAIHHGKAACAPNFTGQWDIYEPEVQRGVAGLRNVLRSLGMVPDEPERREQPEQAASGQERTAPRGTQEAGQAGQAVETGETGETARRWHPSRTRDGIYADPPVFSPDDLAGVEAPAAGLFLPRVQPEERVRPGQSLGTLVRFDDFTEVDVPAPIEALVYRIGAIGPNADVALPPMMPIAAAGATVARLLPVR